MNGSYINLTLGSTLQFLLETPADFRAEHLNKVTVDGSPAVEGTNLRIDPLGTQGSTIAVLPAPLGTNDCMANANTAGLPASMSAAGSPLASANTRHPIGGHLLLEGQVSSSDGMLGDRFGIDCDMDGQTMVVGADRQDQAGFDAGAAYIFERVGAQWIETQKLVSPIASAGDGFGGTVALEADWLVISAPGSQGVFIYRKIGAAWTMYQVLNLPNAQTSGSVEAEIAQGRIAVANRNNGGVYELNVATQRWTLTFGVATASSFSFTGMAFDGDRLVESRVYGLIEVYERNSATGNFGPPRSIGVPSPGAVGLAGDRVLVMEPAAGLVRAFVENGGQWSAAASAPGGMTGPGTIATNGSSVLVGGALTPVLYALRLPRDRDG